MGFVSDKKTAKVDFNDPNSDAKSSRSNRSTSIGARSSRSTGSYGSVPKLVENRINYGRLLHTKSPSKVPTPQINHFTKKGNIDDVIKNEMKFKSQIQSDEKLGKSTIKNSTKENEPHAKSKVSFPGLEENEKTFNTFNTKDSENKFFNDIIELYDKLNQIIENFRLNISNKKLVENLWEDNKFDLIFIAKSQDQGVISDSEYLRQLYLIVLTELVKDIYAHNKPAINSLKNLTFLIHQNLLICCDYIVNNLDTLNFENANKSSIKLQKLLLSHLNLRIKKGEHGTFLKHNNDSIIANLKTLTRYVFI